MKATAGYWPRAEYWKITLDWLEAEMSGGGFWKNCLGAGCCNLCFPNGKATSSCFISTRYTLPLARVKAVFCGLSGLCRKQALAFVNGSLYCCSRFTRRLGRPQQYNSQMLHERRSRKCLLPSLLLKVPQLRSAWPERTLQCTLHVLRATAYTW